PAQRPGQGGPTAAAAPDTHAQGGAAALRPPHPGPAARQALRLDLEHSNPPFFARLAALAPSLEGSRVTPIKLSTALGGGPSLLDGQLESPQFHGLVTPEWARQGQRGPGSTGEGRHRDADFDTRRAALAPDPASPRAADLQGFGSFSMVLGSPPKKARMATPVRGGAPAPVADAAHLLQPESVGRTALAAYLQEGLGLASGGRGRPGSAAAAPSPGPPAKWAGSATADMNSRSVRTSLHALLEQRPPVHRRRLPVVDWGEQRGCGRQGRPERGGPPHTSKPLLVHTSLSAKGISELDWEEICCTANVAASLDPEAPEPELAESWLDSNGGGTGPGVTPVCMRVLSRRCARPGALAPSSLVANTLRGLRDVQEVHGNRWSEVARHIGTKTGQQCAQRWRHRVNPNISKEKWTEAEDNQLTSLVRQYGSCWAEISRNLPGRTDQQCMGRWRRHLDPSVRRVSWHPTEDEKLRELVAEHGGWRREQGRLIAARGDSAEGVWKSRVGLPADRPPPPPNPFTCLRAGASWSFISRFMEGRTAQQVRARWCQLESLEVSRRVPGGVPSVRVAPPDAGAGYCVHDRYVSTPASLRVKARQGGHANRPSAPAKVSSSGDASLKKHLTF
ncbi:hypothetical protein APUTEX25_002971, partial [Auxenochlorella protothecoides]